VTDQRGPRGAVLVRVVAFGYTPRQPSSTEVLMRLIGLAVIAALLDVIEVGRVGYRGLCSATTNEAGI
jgi:hypothetical protein